MQDVLSQTPSMRRVEQKLIQSATVHYHVFVSDSPFVVTTGGDADDILLVGGGGGSSTSLAAGGGSAGGAVHVTTTTLTSGVTYDVVVGAGGAERDVSAPNSGSGNSGGNGSTHPGDSTVLTALGGGYGASYAQTNAANGGCGGGIESSPDTGGLGQPTITRSTNLFIQVRSKH